MANQEILCSVSSCYYNENARNCKAAKIMVQPNPATLDNARMEVGSIGGQPQQSNETLCQTYIPKEKGPKPGIDRLP